ncbi:chemotaxis protein CheW [Sesbania bispinosa]|nr:chemotaxis protein CheW [Sesbania bispinosa]
MGLLWIVHERTKLHFVLSISQIKNYENSMDIHHELQKPDFLDLKLHKKGRLNPTINLRLPVIVPPCPCGRKSSLVIA